MSDNNTYLGKKHYEQILSESNIDLKRASEDKDYTDETKSQFDEIQQKDMQINEHLINICYFRMKITDFG